MKKHQKKITLNDFQWGKEVEIEKKGRNGSVVTDGTKIRGTLGLAAWVLAQNGAITAEGAREEWAEYHDQRLCCMTADSYLVTSFIEKKFMEGGKMICITRSGSRYEVRLL